MVIPNRIDGLVNYAGILPAGNLPDTTEELYNRVMDINFKSAFFCCQFAVREMLKTGGGSILNVGSTHAYGGDKDRAVFKPIRTTSPGRSASCRTKHSK